MKLEERLMRSIMRRSGNVILRSDIAKLGSASQLSEALRALQRKNFIVRIGTGIYAKTRLSSVTGATIPAGSLESLSREALTRLGVEVTTDNPTREYNSGRTTQLPGKFVVNTGNRRIQRNITVGGRHIVYENNYGKSTAST